TTRSRPECSTPAPPGGRSCTTRSAWRTASRTCPACSAGPPRRGRPATRPPRPTSARPPAPAWSGPSARRPARSWTWSSRARAAADEPAGGEDLAACEAEFRGVADHALSETPPHRDRLGRAGMALRLARWLRTPEDRSGSFGQLARRYVDEVSFVDWAREA